MKTDKYIKKLLILSVAIILLLLNYVTVYASSGLQSDEAAVGQPEVAPADATPVMLYYQQRWYEAVNAGGDLTYGDQRFARRDDLTDVCYIDNPDLNYLVVDGTAYPLASEAEFAGPAAKSDNATKLKEAVLIFVLPFLIVIAAVAVTFGIVHVMNLMFSRFCTIDELEDFYEY